MKKVSFIPMIFALVFMMFLPAMTAKADLRFSDVAEDFWAKEEIYSFVESGVVSGYNDGTFRPNQPVTRAQAAIILTNALDLDTGVALPSFHDVTEDFYASQEVAAVAEAEILVGKGNAFQPNQPVTRGQMAKVLAKAFQLDGDGSSSFKDVKADFWAYEAIDALYSHDITSGYDDGTFRPNQPVTRAQFAVFLHKVIDEEEGVSTDLAELLKEVYRNELTIDSYDFEGGASFGIRLPASLTEMDEEISLIAGIMENISFDMKGTYQRDPMVLEMDLALTLEGDVSTTINMPVVMTEETMWLKLPNTPFAPLPDELDGKFIEMNLNELAEMDGNELPASNVELQTELALGIYDVFFDVFTEDFYQEVELGSVTYPNDIQGKHAVTFELSDDELEHFLTLMIERFLPEMVQLMADPAYADVFGLTLEEITMLEEEMETIQVELAFLLEDLARVLTINAFEELIVINEEYVIAFNSMLLDVDFTVADDTFGFFLDLAQSKSNINEKPAFKYGIPSEDDVIRFDEWLYLEN